MEFNVAEDRIKPRDYKGEPVKWAQVKENGHRATVIVNERFGTRVIPAGVELDHWPRICENHPELANKIKRLSRGTVLDGELISSSGNASDVVTAINGGFGLDFRPFAMPYLAGASLINTELDVIDRKLQRMGFRVPHLLPVREAEVDVEVWFKRARAAGIEGFVLKWAHYEGWYKVKPQKTIDAVVMRQTESTSDTKYGMLKAVIVGVYSKGKLVEIANVGGGFSDEQREAYSKLNLTGRVCEVEYQDVLSKGRLQFPRFLRWREDKVPTACTVAQDSDLSEVHEELSLLAKGKPNS